MVHMSASISMLTTELKSPGIAGQIQSTTESVLHNIMAKSSRALPGMDYGSNLNLILTKISAHTPRRYL